MQRTHRHTFGLTQRLCALDAQDTLGPHLALSILERELALVIWTHYTHTYTRAQDVSIRQNTSEYVRIRQLL
jgi:hypothetical protein